MRINVDTTTTPMWIPTRTSQAASESATPTPHYAPLYSSPVIALDRDTGIAVLQFRDPMTGHPISQVPSETVAREYQANAVKLEQALLHGTPTQVNAAANAAPQSAGQTDQNGSAFAGTKQGTDQPQPGIPQSAGPAQIKEPSPIGTGTAPSAPSPDSGTYSGTASSGQTTGSTFSVNA